MNVLDTYQIYWDQEDFIASTARHAMFVTQLSERLRISVQQVLELQQLPDDVRDLGWARAFGMHVRISHDS